MQRYLFDFENIADTAAFYQCCRQQWALPAEFGDNLDALWDICTGYVPLPAEVHLINLCAREDGEQFDELVTLLQEAEVETEGGLRVLIQ